MNAGIMQNQILSPEQMPQRGDIGRPPAHEHRAVFHPMHLGQRAFELSLVGALARDRPAG